MQQDPQDPFVVEVLEQPQPTRDISLDVVVGMFTMAGVVLLCALVGGLIVGGIIVAVRRARDRKAVASTESDHVRLRL